MSGSRRSVSSRFRERGASPPTTRVLRAKSVRAAVLAVEHHALRAHAVGGCCGGTDAVTGPDWGAE